MNNFLNQQCIPCEGGVQPFSRDQISEALKEISHWQYTSEPDRIEREFQFKDFKYAMRFVNQVAELAEAEGHHPDFFVSWNKVRLSLSTHAVKGLSQNDFILAAKINRIKNQAEMT